MGGKHKKCKFIDGCLMTASFGFKDGEGTQFCSKHKVDGMINLLCKLCDCGKARPTYNYQGLFANFCKECKKDGMINVNDKRCKCGKAKPTFNFKGLKAEYCSQCKEPDMINVKNGPCKCGKSTRPNFNHDGLKPEYCSLCKEPDMIDVNHKKCECGKVVIPPFTKCFACNQQSKKDTCVGCKKLFDGKGRFDACYSCNKD